MIPTDRDILAVHRDAAPSREVFELVYEHCQLVWSVASQFVADLDVDGDLVRAGALLHDVGVYRVGTAAYIRHGVLGHELLAGLGFSETICRFASHHTGVGITRADVLEQALPIPVADYLPQSREEELVMYADKFHSKRTPPVFLSGDTYEVAVARWGAEKAGIFADLRRRYGDPALDALSASTGHAVV